MGWNAAQLDFVRIAVLMTPYLQVVRSIAREFFVRLYKPLVVTVAIIAAIALGFSIWLVSFSTWWLILLGIVALLVILAAIILVIGWIILKFIAPVQTKNQKQQVRSFVDKIQRIAEVTATPKVVLLFRLAKDLVAPSEQGFVTSIGQDTVSLRRDFNTLRDSFRA